MENESRMEDDEGSLQLSDWIIIGIMLGASAAVGIYYRFTGGKQKTSEEYFTADRSTGIVLLAIAMMVSLFSGTSMLGLSGETYAYGAQLNFVFFGLILATPIIGYIYLPVFYELNAISVFEYLEKRFGVTVRLLASIANFAQYSIFTGVVIFAPSLALEATTGVNGSVSILLIGLICTFYSTIGGIKAVILTDVLQGILMFASIFCIIGLVHANLEDGIWSVFRISANAGRMNILNFDLDPTIRYGFLPAISSTCLWLSQFAVNQVQVQRMLTTKTLDKARKGMYLNVLLSLALTSLISFSGLSIFAFYSECDPVKAGKIKSFDMIMPFFAKEKMTKIPGLTGLFISGIFSASLSTISALLNSLAAVALADYLKPIYRRYGHEISDEKATYYGKLVALGIGFFSIAVAFLAAKIGSIIQMVAGIHGAIGGPMLGLFTLGMFFESANETGAIVGIVGALIVNIWFVFTPKPRYPSIPVSVQGCENITITNSPSVLTQNSYAYIHRLSFLWFTFIGMCCTLIFGLIASNIAVHFSKETPQLPEANLFTPLIAARIRRRRAQNSHVGSQVFVLDERK